MNNLTEFDLYTDIVLIVYVQYKDFFKVDVIVKRRDTQESIQIK